MRSCSMLWGRHLCALAVSLSLSVGGGPLGRTSSDDAGVRMRTDDFGCGLVGCGRDGDMTTAWTGAMWMDGTGVDTRHRINLQGVDECEGMAGWDTWGHLCVHRRAQTKECRLRGECIANPAWICGQSKIGLTNTVLSFLPSHSHMAPSRHAEYNEEQSPEYE